MGEAATLWGEQRGPCAAWLACACCAFRRLRHRPGAQRAKFSRKPRNRPSAASWSRPRRKAYSLWPPTHALWAARVMPATRTSVLQNGFARLHYRTAHVSSHDGEFRQRKGAPSRSVPVCDCHGREADRCAVVAQGQAVSGPVALGDFSVPPEDRWIVSRKVRYLRRSLTPWVCPRRPLQWTLVSTC